MSSSVDDAIANYVSDQSEAGMRALDNALMAAFFMVPLREKAREISPGKFDIPTVSIRTTDGSVLPVFTSDDHMRAWKPEGGEYARLQGPALVRMVQDMPEIAAIIINIKSEPRGLIPRSDFARLLALGASF